MASAHNKTLPLTASWSQELCFRNVVIATGTYLRAKTFTGKSEIIVALHNHSKEEVIVEDKERVAQMVITPYVLADYQEVDALGGTERGEGRFGSTGRK